MKKRVVSVFFLLFQAALFFAVSPALAVSPADGRQVLQDAETLNEQLDIINILAEEHADMLETGGWENSLTVRAAQGLPDDLIPADWDSFTYTTEESFPAYMQDHRFIILSCAENEPTALAGDLMVRLPEEMRATSVEDAEYAMIIRWELIESDYQYVPPATSYHRDYTAYAVNLKTGERTVFWNQRNSAKSSGQWGQLDGDLLTQEELWTILRPQFLPILRYEQPDGSALLFVLTGNSCFLNGYEGDLTDLTLPSEVEGHPVTGIETMFSECKGIARVTIEEGITSLPENLFNGGYLKQVNISCCYLPSSLKGGLTESGIGRETVIYAPEDSYAADVAEREGYEWVPCSDPEEMPPAEEVREGAFTFRIFRDEAAVLSYEGEESAVSVPETVSSVPVTSLLSGSFYDLDNVETIVIPESVRRISRSAVSPDSIIEMHVYLTNPETILEDNSIRESFVSTPLTIHAPKESSAEEYVKETGSDGLLFEVWDEEDGSGSDPDERALSDALAMAVKLGESAAGFWADCDQSEYSWLSHAAAYDYEESEAAAVIRLSGEQYDDLALLMGGKDNVARVFATIVNTQWNLPYAKASARMVQSDIFSPSSDGSCMIVVIAYSNDLVLVTLSGDGSAHAALICSSPEVTRNMTVDYINGIAAQYGVSGECTIYEKGFL